VCPSSTIPWEFSAAISGEEGGQIERERERERKMERERERRSKREREKESNSTMISVALCKSASQQDFQWLALCN
jgi:hypothetical protein